MQLKISVALSEANNSVFILNKKWQKKAYWVGFSLLPSSGPFSIYGETKVNAILDYD